MRFQTRRRHEYKRKQCYPFVRSFQQLTTISKNEEEDVINRRRQSEDNGKYASGGVYSSI